MPTLDWIGKDKAISHHLFRYFLVFEDKELEQDGAYKLDKFVDVFREL